MGLESQTAGRGRNAAQLEQCGTTWQDISANVPGTVSSSNQGVMAAMERACMSWARRASL